MTISCAEAKGEYGRQRVRWDYATRCVPPIFPSPVAATRASFRRTPSHPWPRLATTVWRNLLRHGQHRRMMNPLPGICHAHRTVSGYRYASPHGDGLPVRAKGSPSVTPTIVHCSLYIGETTPTTSAPPRGSPTSTAEPSSTCITCHGGKIS